MTEIPSGKVGACASPEYYAIVGHGLTVVPDLAELLSNATPTTINVPLVSGVYAIGDIAMSLISSIISNVPWLSFVTDSGDPEIEAIGFGVYWQHVRAAEENRQALREKFLSWFTSHEHLLVWQPQPKMKTGAWYRLVNVEQNEN
jgi:hypothetical protein